jgi:threonine dehydratase
MDLADIQAARERIAGDIRTTPCSRSVTLSAITGANVFLKFENQQFTASFKERGALNCLLCLSEQQRQQGIIAMSAGNHAQAVAYHGSRLGIPTCIVMPRSTPNAKVEQTRVFGAEIHLHGSGFDETLEYTHTLASERGLVLVHPFDDERVIAGQGTLGLEVLEQVPDVEALIIPVGGGGLIGGTALAVKSLAPNVHVAGVQMQRFSAAYHRFNGTSEGEHPTDTVAEGIAVKSPAAQTWSLIERHVDELFQVTEEQVEQALFTLLEIEKTVVEGAGAASLAALMGNQDRYAGKNVVLVVSGGNIDMMILSSVLQRGLVRSHRLMRLAVEIPDVPGALAELTAVFGELDSNIISIDHQRAFGSSSVRATLVELVLQMRGEEQVDQVVEALRSKGYEVKVRDA